MIRRKWERLLLRQQATIVFLLMAVFFVMVVFFTPAPEVYSISHVENAKIINYRISNSRFRRSEVSVDIEFPDGKQAIIRIPTSKIVLVGDIVEVEVLVSKSEKRKYRLVGF